VTVDQVTDGAGLLRAQRAVELVSVDPSVRQYCVALTRATRESAQVLLGASPRGSLALVLTARARAVIAGRDYVVPEDVKAVTVAALAHRITLRPEVWMRDVSTADIVSSVLAQVPTPRAGGTPTPTR
jgi:MoxR-like ATPase